MQKITLIGNLGSDPEERFTPNQKKVKMFSLAVNISKDKTCWYQINVWEDRIPILQGILNCLKKGSRVCVIGDLGLPHAYMNKMQLPAVKLVVNANSLNFVSSPISSEQEAPKAPPPQRAEDSPNYMGGYAKQYKNEDIPF